MLGAAALGDIGIHFPPSAAQWRDADSLDMLRRASALLEERGYQVVNVDVTVVCEAPRIGPHVGAMRERLAATLGIGTQHVSVKGKTNEGMGWIGRGEGIAVMATALIATVEE
jgi:2-C-methyl-D-erythritol 2,4-cyclodiphosphate synthase